jgi:DNA-binding transcriptional LysR family regulator
VRRRILRFKSEVIKLLIAMRCGSTEGVKEAVAHGAGVGILYHDAVKRDIERGEFKAVTIPGLSFRRQSYIVYSKDKPLSSVAQEFLALLRESKKEDLPVKSTSAETSRGRLNGHARSHSSIQAPILNRLGDV